MLSKIYLKDFQKNMKNYLFCFWGIVLSNVFYFCFLKIVSEFYGDNAVKEGFEYHEMQMYQTVIGLVTVLFLILALKFYVESRRESYRITIILGESRKTTGRRLLMECIFLWGGSSLACIGLDLVAGAALDCIFGYSPEVFWDGILSGMEYNTVIWFAGIVICTIGLFRQKKRTRRVKGSRKKMPYYQTAGFVAGVVLVAGSIGITEAVPMCRSDYFGLWRHSEPGRTVL